MADITNYNSVPNAGKETVPVAKAEKPVVSAIPSVTRPSFFHGMKQQLIEPIIANIQQNAIQIISNSILNGVSDLVNGILWGKGVPQQRTIGPTTTNYNAVSTTPNVPTVNPGVASAAVQTLPANRVQLFRFKRREDAALVQDQMLDAIRNYGKTKLYDYYIWSGHSEYANPTCNYTGWTDLSMSDILTVPPQIGEEPGPKYILRLPDPVRIE